MNVLIVEDDEAIRDLLAEVMAREGHAPIVCADAEEAWQACQVTEFALILLDRRLPGLDGVTFCRQLRAHPHGQASVVLVITADARAADLAEILDAGADDYLAKPFDLRLLRVRLSVAMRQVQLKRERASLEGRLRHQANHDALTGLPNRRLMLDELERALTGPERRRAGLAILYIDLDEFKEINDNHGHEIGDQVLVAASRRLLDCVRSADTVGRLGGDEFLVILRGVGHTDEALAVTRRMLAAFDQPFSLPTGVTRCVASIGVAVARPRQTTASDLIAAADAAMYVAKQSGNGRCAVAPGTAPLNPNHLPLSS